MLNAFTLDTTTGASWQGPDIIGNASLLPGASLAIAQPSTTLTTALTVDRDGMLNAFTLDTTTGASWQGPDIIGNASLLPGSLLKI
jgi:hypothetical protein